MKNRTIILITLSLLIPGILIPCIHHWGSYGSRDTSITICLVFSSLILTLGLIDLWLDMTSVAKKYTLIIVASLFVVFSAFFIIRLIQINKEKKAYNENINLKLLEDEMRKKKLRETNK